MRLKYVFWWPFEDHVNHESIKFRFLLTIDDARLPSIPAVKTDDNDEMYLTAITDEELLLLAMVPVMKNPALIKTDDPAAADECVTGDWSIENQPPAHCSPYPKGLFQIKLPNAGKGGPTNHLAPDSDAIAANSLLPGDLNGTQIEVFHEDDHLAVTAGLADGISNPIYYGRASDPIYKVTDCRRPGLDPKHDPNHTYWHIPENASYSAGTSDMFFTVWDQTTNLLLSAYQSHQPGDKYLGACSAKTHEDACPMFKMDYCTYADYTEDLGYTPAAPDGRHRNGAGDSLESAPAALVVKFKEWMAGEIRHAIYLNTLCESIGVVFPAPGPYQALHCSTPWSWPMGNLTGLRPKHGSLYFLDYTDEQIDSMKLPAWQKPMIVAMAHYGGYVGDTGGHKYDGTIPTRIEGAEAYATAGVECPVFKWLEAQGVSHHIDTGATVYTGGWWANLGNHSGVNCPDEPCGVLEHIHIAHECVPLGMAGLPGGCARQELTSFPTDE